MNDNFLIDYIDLILGTTFAMVSRNSQRSMILMVMFCEIVTVWPSIANSISPPKEMENIKVTLLVESIKLAFCLRFTNEL